MPTFAINPKFGFAVSLLALAAFLWEITYGNPGLTSFVLGYIFTLPLIIMIWRAMRKHWPIYKKFYSMSLHKRDMKTVIRSWKLTWWVLPYTLVVYSILEIIILQNPSLGSLLSDRKSTRLNSSHS